MKPISKITGGALAATGAVLAVCAVVAVVLLSGTASSSAASTASTTTISTRQTAIGTILVGPGGETVYAFTGDTHNRDRCASVHGCLTVWPMLVAHGSPSAGHGVHRSLLGTITVHGARQVTYAGHPLYTYAQSDGPHDISYVGATEFGGRWPAINDAGHFVR